MPFVRNWRAEWYYHSRKIGELDGNTLFGQTEDLDGRHFSARMAYHSLEIGELNGNTIFGQTEDLDGRYSARIAYHSLELGELNGNTILGQTEDLDGRYFSARMICHLLEIGELGGITVQGISESCMVLPFVRKWRVGWSPGESYAYHVEENMQAKWSLKENQFDWKYHVDMKLNGIYHSRSNKIVLMVVPSRADSLAPVVLPCKGSHPEPMDRPQWYYHLRAAIDLRW
jgi:hypothetical protein